MKTNPSSPPGNLRRVSIALAVGGLAGWWSVPPLPETADGETRTAAILSPFPAAPNNHVSEPPPAGQVSARLEKELLAMLNPGAETFSGERLAELCLGDNATDLPEVGKAWVYAGNWAKAAPEEMLAWFRARGSGKLILPNGPLNSHNDFSNLIFRALTVKNPEGAIRSALQEERKSVRRGLVANVIGTLRLTDPGRASALAAEQAGLLAGGERNSSEFSAVGKDYPGMWDLLRALPAGGDRNRVLAQYFDAIAGNHPQDTVAMWSRMPAEERRELVEGGFQGMGLRMGGSSASLEGLNELWRDHALASRDPEVLEQYLRAGATQWAASDPAAAITWARENLIGEARVLGTARLFREGAQSDFDATLAVWRDLPEGGLRARAAGYLAAGAPEERRAEAEALLSSLPPADQAAARASK